METENFKKAREVFKNAIEIKDPTKQEIYLDNACGGDRALRVEVEALLRSYDEAGDFLEGPAADPGKKLINSPLIEGPGTKIGRYELLELIGEGGMGLVYLAQQQEPVKRKVALKIVKFGMDTKQVVARFEAERQTLALLEHPNIAHVFDAGTTEAGRPYFVMEYVEGMSITKYCDERKLNVEERLELFKQVCEGVHHAHQKGIIHRDIKPSNILVSTNGDKAIPKIIDFGIAKAITQPLTEETSFTKQGQLLGTPEYMSPEQAEMAYQDIDTRSDIYSLGIVLYELLSGVTPFDAKRFQEGGIDYIQKVICEEKPKTPSARLTSLGDKAKTVAESRRTQIITLTRRLHRELEWIPMKAMRKDRTRRYRSASELADDVQNYLTGTPLVAGPESTIYIARKFVRKHAGSVATAALVAVVIIIGLVVSIVMGCRAEQAREKEVAARKQVEKALARAENAERIANERAEDYRRLLYFNRIALAESSYRDGNMNRVNELLKACPQDLRNWEWDRLDYISSDQSLMTLTGHNHLVFALALSPDGKRLASGSYDKTIKIWDTESGRELMTLKGHKDAVDAVSFSPDGKKIASGSSDKTIRIWDAESGVELKTLEGHGQVVRSVAFSPDGRRIISASNDKTVKIWDMKEATELMTLRGHERRVSCAAISPDGKYIASADAWNGMINLWDASTGTQLRTLRGHKAGVLSIAFSPDSKCIVSGGSNDNTIMVWDTESGTELLKLTGHTGFVLSVSFSPDGRLIISGSTDGMIKVWDANSGDEVMSLHGHEDFALAVLFSADGRRIFSGGRDKTIKIWDTVIDHENTVFVGQVGVYPLAISPDGARVVSTCGPNGKMVQLWDIAAGTEIATLRGHNDYIISVSTSPDGRYIASASMDKTAKVWDAENGREVMTLTGHDDGVGAAVFGPDSKLIATGSFDKTIKIWNAKDGNAIKTFRGHTDGVRSVAFSPDGERLASGGRDGTVRVWNVRTGRQVMLLRGEDDSRVQAVAFTSDGMRIVSGSGNIVKVWNARTGDDLLTLRGHQKLVYALAISPDGKRIVSGGRFGVIKVWDAVTGAEVLTLRHSGHGLAFSPDGRTIVASVDTGIMLFESEKTPDSFKMRWTGAMAKELVNNLHEEHDLYSKVMEMLRADERLEESVRKVALKIASAHLWEDEEKKQ